MMQKFYKIYPALVGQKNQGFTHTLTSKNGRKVVCGFTLVETLVAVSIFTLSILGLLVILSQGISDTGYAKKKMIADYLNQEGIEYMRNMRDTYVLYDATDTQTGWDAFNTKIFPAANTLCNNSNGCYFDDRSTNYTNHTQATYIGNLSINACGSACPHLLYDGTTGKYGYVSGVDSGFIRKIFVTKPSINETKISSTVYWTQGSGSYNIVFSESVFNWVE